MDLSLLAFPEPVTTLTSGEKFLVWCAWAGLAYICFQERRRLLQMSRWARLMVSFLMLAWVADTVTTVISWLPISR